MIICPECKKEMKCMKNGIACVWNNSHVYMGDSFKCISCDKTIVHCNDLQFNDKDVLTRKNHSVIKMD